MLHSLWAEMRWINILSSTSCLKCYLIFYHFITFLVNLLSSFKNLWAYQMWVIATNDCHRMTATEAVAPPFSNSAPCFVSIQGQRGSALVSLAQSKTLICPPTPPHHHYQFRDSVFCLSFSLCKHKVRCFRGFQRGGGVMSCSSAACSLEVVCMYQSGEERLSLTKCTKNFIHFIPLTFLDSLMCLFGWRTQCRQSKSGLTHQMFFFSSGCVHCTCSYTSFVCVRIVVCVCVGGVSRMHQQQEAVDRLVCMPLIQQSGTETGNKQTREPWEGVGEPDGVGGGLKSAQVQRERGATAWKKLQREGVCKQ